MLPPRRAGFFLLATALALLIASAVSSLGLPPVFDPIPVLDPANPADPPKVPVGKTLVVPISVTTAASGPVSFKVASSNARLPVRVKTGNPILRIHVTYAGDGLAEPFAGDLDFQLFSDLAPITTGFIGGFAQAGYYDGLKFHRIIEDFVAQGGDPAGTGSGVPPGGGANIGLPFVYEDELHPALIFAGRGQLAMANPGLNRGSALGDQILLGSFRATNGSQFFISFEQLRDPRPTHQVNLDFKHTIFGQLIRGFDLLAKIESIPKVAATPPDVPDEPTVDVKMETVTVLPGTSEATLFIGATGAGETTITMTATDANGEVSKFSFPVRTVDDPVNDPPIMLPLAPIFANVGTQPQLQVRAVDLELDYLLYGIASAGNGTSAGSFGDATITGSYTARQSAGRQPLALGVAGFNDERRFGAPTSGNAFAPFDAYHFQVVDLVFGDKAARGEAVVVQGTPGNALTNVLVARLHDLDPAGTPATFTAQINWGDGTATTAGALSRDSSAPGAASYAITGTHTYANRGVYKIVVTATGTEGTPAVVRSTAVISAAPLVAVGTHHDVTGAKLTNRLLATFTDTDSTRRAADYVATVDWGDGLTSRGLVSKAPDGSFLVRGTHAYRDSQTYAIAVHVQKKDAIPAVGDVAWSTAILRFNSAPYFPPFPQAHFTLGWTAGPSKAVTNAILGNLDPAALEVQLSGNLFLASSGSRTLASPKVRFWLSSDSALQNTDTQLFFDVPAFSLSNVKELRLASLAPGLEGTLFFRVRLPKGVSGAGQFLLSEAVYADPIANHSASGKVGVIGPIDPGILALGANGNALAASLQTTEAGGQATFRVVLDTAPSADVTISIESNTVTEGTVAPATLTFTTADWNVPQTVTVTGVDDAADDGNKSYTVTLKTPVTTDPAYLGLPARTINATNTDND